MSSPEPLSSLRAPRRLLLVLGAALLSAVVAMPVLAPSDAVAAEKPRIPKKNQRGKRDFVLVAGGDVAYPRGWMDRLVDRMGPKMYDQVRKFAKDADLAFLNLESPYTDAEFKLKKEWQIATAPGRLDYVLEGGFNFFSLANNHMGDAGDQGIFDTLDLLEKKNSRANPLFWGGAVRNAKDLWKPEIFEVPGKDLKVVFFAFGYAKNPLVPTPSPSALEAVARHKKNGDIVIVSVHAGTEYKHVPDKAKTELYRRFMDAGADILLGHHPHVPQGVELYKDGIIFHSLGNFSFASKTKRHHKTGAKLYSILPRIYVKDGKVDKVEIIPLYVNNGEPMKVGNEVLRPTDFQPQVVTGVFADTILAELKQWTLALPGISERAKNAFEIKGDRAVIRVRGK